MTEANAVFVAQRQGLMDAATDPELKEHFQAEIDLVKSWDVDPSADLNININYVPPYKVDTVVPFVPSKEIKSKAVVAASATPSDPTEYWPEPVTPDGFDKTQQTQPLSAEESNKIAALWIENLQKDLGITKEQAEGIVANLWHESAGMNTGINQKMIFGPPSGNLADDNANGYGIAQWGGSRKTALIAFAGGPEKAASQDVQYRFFVKELKEQYPAVLQAIKNSSTAEQAMDAFMLGYEKPTDPQRDSRLTILHHIQGL